MNIFWRKVTHCLYWNHNSLALNAMFWRLPSQHSSKQSSGRSQECGGLVLVSRATMNLIRPSLIDSDLVVLLVLPAEPQDGYVEVH